MCPDSLNPWFLDFTTTLRRMALRKPCSLSDREGQDRAKPSRQRRASIAPVADARVKWLWRVLCLRCRGSSAGAGADRALGECLRGCEARETLCEELWILVDPVKVKDLHDAYPTLTDQERRWGPAIRPEAVWFPAECHILLQPRIPLVY